MLAKFLTGAALTLVLGGAASAQGLGTAATYSRAQEMSIASSTPRAVGEFARTNRSAIINSTPDYSTIAFDHRFTGYVEPYGPPAAQEIAPPAGGQ